MTAQVTAVQPEAGEGDGAGRQRGNGDHDNPDDVPSQSHVLQAQAAGEQLGR